MAARIGTNLNGRDARSLGSADIVSGMLFETQRPCLNQPKLVRITLASKNDRMRVDNGQTESQLSLPGHCGQWPILSLDLPPKGACPSLSAYWRDRARGVIRNGTDRRRKTGPPKGDAGSHLCFIVSHLSAKSAERWGTLRLYVIQEFSPAPENSPAQAIGRLEWATRAQNKFAERLKSAFLLVPERHG